MIKQSKKYPPTHTHILSRTHDNKIKHEECCKIRMMNNQINHILKPYPFIFYCRAKLLNWRPDKR